MTDTVEAPQIPSLEDAIAKAFPGMAVLSRVFDRNGNVASVQIDTPRGQRACFSPTEIYWKAGMRLPTDDTITPSHG